MARIETHVEGLHDVQAALDKLSRMSFSDTFGKIGQRLIPFFSGPVFLSRGGVIGESWPDLAPSTQERKAKRFPGRPTLVETGDMQGAFTAEAGPDRVTIGNSDPKFGYHQGEQRSGKLPRRAMLKISPEVQEIATDIFEQDLDAKIRAL
jgi:hypothetical protein